MKPTRVLTGYLPTGEVLRAVENVLVQLKQTKPGIIYLLDRMLSLFLLAFVDYISSGDGRFGKVVRFSRRRARVSRHVTSCDNNNSQLVRSRVSVFRFRCRTSLVNLWQIAYANKIGRYGIPPSILRCSAQPIQRTSCSSQLYTPRNMAPFFSPGVHTT